MGSKILAFVLAVVVCVLAYFLIKSNGDISQISKLLNEKADTVKKWKDAYGEEHATLQQAQMDYSVAKVLHQLELDSLAKLYHTSAGNIQSNTVTHDHIGFDVTPGKVVTVYYPDTGGCAVKRIKRLTGTFDDFWLHSVVTLGDTNRIKADITDTTGITQYTKGFFNAKPYIDVSHRSPYVHTNSITSFAIRPPSGGFDVGIFAGAGYDIGNLSLSHPRPIIGIGISKTIFSFGKK
jgi:hypothetical protein